MKKIALILLITASVVFIVLQGCTADETTTEGSSTVTLKGEAI